MLELRLTLEGRNVEEARVALDPELPAEAKQVTAHWNQTIQPPACEIVIEATGIPQARAMMHGYLRLLTAVDSTLDEVST